MCAESPRICLRLVRHFQTILLIFWHPMKGSSLYFALLLFLVSVHSVFSQRVGLSGGASVDPITSLRLAAIYEQDIHTWLSLQPEISFLQKGHPSMVDRLFAEPPGLGYGAVSEVAVECLLKLKMELSDFSIYLLAGPSLSRFVGAVAVYAGEDEVYQRVRVPVAAYGLKHWDWGGTVGLGVERQIRKNQKIFVDVRYYQGLQNLNLDQGNAFFLESLYFDFGMFIPLQASGKKQEKKSQVR